MTIEEAKSCICTIKILQKLAYNIHGVMDVVDADNCKKIIKALEQEPCEDCISRQAVKDMLDARGVKAVMTFEHFKELLDKLPSVTPTHKEWIPVPEGATNGDMIKAMFPNCEQKEHINNGYFEMYFDGDFGNASYMRVSKDWWNAPYKAEREE